MQVAFVLQLYYPDKTDKIDHLMHASSSDYVTVLSNSCCMYQNCFGLQLAVFTFFGFIVKKRFGSCIQSTSNATHNLGIPVVLKGELFSKRVSSYACIFCAILNNLVRVIYVISNCHKRKWQSRASLCTLHGNISVRQKNEPWSCFLSKFYH